MILLLVVGSPIRVRLCGCLRHFGDHKNNPLELWRCNLCQTRPASSESTSTKGWVVNHLCYGWFCTDLMHLSMDHMVQRLSVEMHSRAVCSDPYNHQHLHSGLNSSSLTCTLQPISPGILEYASCVFSFFLVFH